MEKNTKVKAHIKLDSGKGVEGEGVVKDSRIVFGREEVLLSIKKLDPIWITTERVEEL